MTCNSDNCNPYQRFKEQKKRAAQRKIAWRLEYWEWLQIWQESGHLEERGYHKGEWVMGRNFDRGAYETGNVKIVRAETNNHWAAVWRRERRLANQRPSKGQCGVS